MTGVALSVVLQASLSISATPTLAEAVKISEASGKPILVMVGADWCRYCKVVEQTAMPQITKSGLLEKVVYVYLDYDKDRKLVTPLLEGDVIPELIVLRKSGDRWTRDNLGGMEMFTPYQAGRQQEVKFATIESFIKSAVAEKAAAEEGTPATEEGTPATASNAAAKPAGN